MKVFISHSSHDKWASRQLSRQLTEIGCQTFLDEKDIRTGDSIDETLQVHLKDSDDLLIVVSPHSLKSQWVFIEIGGAKALGKRIVPILFHVEPNEVPMSISKHLARDINDFDRYVEELRLRISGQPPKHASAASKKPTARGTAPPSGVTKTVDGFKVGERVRIIDVGLLTSDEKDLWPKWTEEMDKYSEAEGTITKVTWSMQGDPDIGVNLSVDDEEFVWATRWLRKVA